MEFGAVVIVIFMALDAAAAEYDGPWIADAAGCKFRNPNPQPDEKITWSGGCRDGFGDGPGVLQWYRGDKPGSRTEATFVRGAAQGAGRFVATNGATYDGTLAESHPDGFGTMIWPNGDRYDGEWQDGKRTGHGTFTRPNGDRYDGDFVDGKWQGKGLFVNLSAVRYLGDWVSNKRQGEGVAVLPDGGLYRGAFIDDVPAHPEQIKHNHYDLRVERTGSHIGEVLIRNLVLPSDTSYADLSDDDKFIARAWAATPSESDEPPYPIYGPHRILEASIKIQNKFRTEGRLVLGVTVNPEGIAQETAILSSPDRDTAVAMAQVLMAERYKPAICAGKPCTQKYYFRMNYARH